MASRTGSELEPDYLSSIGAADPFVRSPKSSPATAASTCSASTNSATCSRSPRSRTPLPSSPRRGESSHRRCVEQRRLAECRKVVDVDDLQLTTPGPDRPRPGRRSDHHREDRTRDREEGPQTARAGGAPKRSATRPSRRWPLRVTPSRCLSGCSGSLSPATTSGANGSLLHGKSGTTP